MGRSMTKQCKVKIDLSDWDMGCWPIDLFKARKVDRDEFSAEVTFSLDSEIFAKAARKIAKEAIESFLENLAEAWFTPEGIEFRGDDRQPLGRLSWAYVMNDRQGLAALRAWLDDQEAELAAEHG